MKVTIEKRVWGFYQTVSEYEVPDVLNDDKVIEDYVAANELEPVHTLSTDRFLQTQADEYNVVNDSVITVFNFSVNVVATEDALQELGSLIFQATQAEWYENTNEQTDMSTFEQAETVARHYLTVWGIRTKLTPDNVRARFGYVVDRYAQMSLENALAEDDPKEIRLIGPALLSFADDNVAKCSSPDCVSNCQHSALTH